MTFIAILILLFMIGIFALAITLPYTDFGRFFECEGIPLSVEEIIELSEQGFVEIGFKRPSWDWEGFEPTSLVINRLDENGKPVSFKPRTFEDYKKVAEYVRNKEGE